MTRYTLLLRGINVGRAHRVAMADLRSLLEDQGHREVRTLLNSGNVVLDTGLPPDELARSVERALEERFGFAIGTVVRTAQELIEVVAKDPLGSIATDPTRYVVTFFAGDVPTELEARLHGTDPGDDAFAVDGRELYVWCPRGQLDSPLAAAAGKHRGGPVGTARNWATVRKLADLLQR
jgi:uncharacterized protein (DUF1697 family)